MDIFTVNEETCTKCGACTDVCHLGIIDFQKQGYPKPFPEVTEKMCSKCAACMIVCQNKSFMHRDISYEECPLIDSNLDITYEQCNQLLKIRRSIRAFKDTPVPRDVILKAIESARFSPTANNIQNVQWLIIDNKDMVDNFRKVGNAWMATVIKNAPGYAPLGAIFEKREEAGMDSFLRGAPVIVSVFAEKSNPANAMICPLSLAYFDLAAISLGLGCCWDGFFTGAANNFPPIKDAIALPEEYQIYGSMAVGYPKYKHYRIPMRNQARITWK